jgi:hypothetical protein
MIEFFWLVIVFVIIGVSIHPQWAPVIVISSLCVATVVAYVKAVWLSWRGK